MESVFGTVTERLRHYKLLACGIEPPHYGLLIASIREDIDHIVERAKTRRERYRLANPTGIPTIRYFGSGKSTNPAPTELPPTV